MNAVATRRALSLSDPEPALGLIASAKDELDLTDVTLVEMWALCAAAARARHEQKQPLLIKWSGGSPARAFAQAVGFEEVLTGTTTEVRGEPGRTVRLKRVFTEEDVHPVSKAIADLLAGTAHVAAQQTIQYVMTELLRNVIQHSDDPQGAVVGAQLNDRGLHQDRPVFQVVVVDTGRGIRASLSRTHTDVDDDKVALERSLWPYVSGAFAPGRSGGLENAGLGLFYVSEFAKALDGRMLLASGGASLIIDPGAAHRLEFLGVGYPGTLVAFEVPVVSALPFEVVFGRIGELASARTPRRVTHASLSFVAAPPENTPRFAVNAFVENNDEAAKLAQGKLVPMLARKEPFTLDFVNVRMCTQSFAHALLYDVIRFAWASSTPVFIVNAIPVVRSALLHVETYAQGG